MANLNLSQFTEKTFVADADWVFVWDTAGAISKKVSRNSLLNSGTLTTSAPVTISQTWDAGTNVMTALKVVATDTASGTASNLFEGWSGSTAALKLRIDKNGGVISADVNPGLSSNFRGSGSTSGIGFNSGNMWYGSSIYFVATQSKIRIASSHSLGWSTDIFNADADTILLRDGAANTLALRNSTAAQTFNVYGTYTSGTSYERLTLSAPSAANAIIGTNKGSGGGTARGLELQTNGVTRMSISGSDPFLATLGSSVSSQWLELSANAGTTLQYNSTHKIYFSSSVCEITANNTTITTGLVRFSGATSSFPALKRSTTYLQARLADDSAFAPIQGKLTTDTAFTSGAITDTGYIVLYDSTGAAYKVACTPV